jgi:hypothetical protein
MVALRHRADLFGLFFALPGARFLASALAVIDLRLELELVHQLAHGGSRFVEGGLLIGRERDLDDLLHPAAAQLHRHAHVEALRPVLAFEIREHGRIFFLSLRIASTISTAEAAGA